jgi:hypothetical protein
VDFRKVKKNPSTRVAGVKYVGDRCSRPGGLARSVGAPILTVEDSYVGRIGSEIAEAAGASGDGPRVRMLAARNIPKTGARPLTFGPVRDNHEMAT